MNTHCGKQPRSVKKDMLSASAVRDNTVSTPVLKMPVRLEHKVLSLILCTLCSNAGAAGQSVNKPSAESIDFSPEAVDARRLRIRQSDYEQLAKLRSRNADNISLARQLQTMLLRCMAPRLSPRPSSQEVALLVEEWLQTYSQLPDFDKRFLASRALYIAKLLREGAEVSLTAKNSRVCYPDDAEPRAKMGGRMADVVVQSAASGHWLIDPFQRASLLEVAADNRLDQKTRDAAKIAVENAGTPIGREALALVVSLETSARTKDTGKDTRQCMETLTALFQQLSETEKQSLAPNIVNADVELLSTSLFRDAEPLLWLVERSVNSSRWLCSPEGSLESDFFRAHLVYLKRGNFAAAERLLRTVVLLRERNGHNTQDICNARMALGYFLKKNGRLDQAKEQFEVALVNANKTANDPELKEILLTTGYCDYIADIQREIRGCQCN